MLPFNGINPGRRAINENPSCTRKCLAPCTRPGLIIVRSMKHAVAFLLVLVSAVGAAESNNNYRIVKSARIFAIGGIGYAGVVTDEETAFNALCKAPDAAN